jgi:hypothetical protein
MDDSNLPGFLLNVVGSVLTGVLVPLLIGMIRKQRGWPKLGKTSWVVLTFGVAALVFAALFFGSPKPEVGLTVTEIETAAPEAQPDGETSYQVQVKGTVTHWKDNVYLVVKPLNSPYWFVQPAANRIGPVDKGKSEWEGVARFETAVAGNGEQFSIYALASSARFTGNEELKAEPVGTKSEAKIITGANIKAEKQ